MIYLTTSECILIGIGILIGFPIGAILSSLKWVGSCFLGEIMEFRNRYFVVSEFIPSKDEKIIKE